MQEIPRKILLHSLLLFLCVSPSTQNPQEEESKDIFLLKSPNRFGSRVTMEVEGHLPDFCIPCETRGENKIVNFGTKSRGALTSNKQLLLPFFMSLFLIY
ncbi:unnamed protein product [Cochlearia groenlandica]